MDYAPTVKTYLEPDTSHVTSGFSLWLPAGGEFSPSYTVSYLRSSGTHKNGGGSADYGTYYNWHAAIAYFHDRAPYQSSGYANGQFSVCPSGWVLPPGGSGIGTWTDLFKNVYGGDAKAFIEAFEPVYSGTNDSSGSSVSGSGSRGEGVWWSRHGTYPNNYTLRVTADGEVSDKYLLDATRGAPVRCVAARRYSP